MDADAGAVARVVVAWVGWTVVGEANGKFNESGDPQLLYRHVGAYKMSGFEVYNFMKFTVFARRFWGPKILRQTPNVPWHTSRCFWSSYRSYPQKWNVDCFLFRLVRQICSISGRMTIPDLSNYLAKGILTLLDQLEVIEAVHVAWWDIQFQCFAPTEVTRNAPALVGTEGVIIGVQREPKRISSIKLCQYQRYLMFFIFSGKCRLSTRFPNCSPGQYSVADSESARAVATASATGARLAKVMWLLRSCQVIEKPSIIGYWTVGFYVHQYINIHIYTFIYLLPIIDWCLERLASDI